MAVRYIHTEDIHNTGAAQQVLPYVFELIHPSSVVDIGCGTGSWLQIAKACGASSVLGVDGVQVTAAMRCIEAQEFLQHDLTAFIQLPDKYDLAICLEVAEHLPETAADTLIDTLSASSEIILFSAAVPGQGGQEHVNEQGLDYWQEKFRSRGFFPVDMLREKFWENKQIDWWYRQNMLLYVTLSCAKENNLTVSERLPLLIHPELLALKVKMLEQVESANRYLEELVDREITHPRFLPALRKLVKSLVK
ncbi:MAG TPA: class I SAM-dependent methyltransferase [Mucilaginibacter sp.]